MSHQLLIKDCSLVTFFNDGYNAIKILENIDLLVEDGTIRTMDRNIEADCETIDAEGKFGGTRFCEWEEPMPCVKNDQGYCRRPQV